MACLHLMRDTLEGAIYVDTGYAYPETEACVAYAARLVTMHVVHADRKAQNKKYGVPSDVVPIDWTYLGQLITQKKQAMLQSYLQCCTENIAVPLHLKAKELGATELVYGQRRRESHRGLAYNGFTFDGVTRLHPIEDWTEREVIDYLAERMELPVHYLTVKHSSLDCHDCPAFAAHSKDRVAFTKLHHPELYRDYLERAQIVQSSLEQALLEQA